MIKNIFFICKSHIFIAKRHETNLINNNILKNNLLNYNKLIIITKKFGEIYIKFYNKSSLKTVYNTKYYLRNYSVYQKLWEVFTK